MEDMSPAHKAVEFEDLNALDGILKSGGDPNEEHAGMTLLHHAIDVELDGHIQTGKPLHVDTTALLLAHGADPQRRSDGGRGVTSEHFALVNGHWLASALIEAWLRRGKARPESPA